MRQNVLYFEQFLQTNNQLKNNSSYDLKSNQVFWQKGKNKPNWNNLCLVFNMEQRV